MNQRIADLVADLRDRASRRETHTVVPIQTALALVEQRRELLIVLTRATLAEDPNEWIQDARKAIASVEAP